MAEPCAPRGRCFKATTLGEHAVPIFGIALLLTVAGIATFPCWRHSRNLGYGPSTSVGILLVLVALLAMGHRSDVGEKTGPTTAKAVKMASTTD